jgi:ABC-type amino acid transport system permease subunit
VELVMVLVLRPVAFTVAFVRETPAVVPAVVAMLFLYVGLPLLIAEDYL